MVKHRHPGKYKSKTKKGKLVKKRRPIHKISKKVMNNNKHLTWKQLHKKFPQLNALADSDGDGLRNYQDCRPFDRTKQDFGRPAGSTKQWIDELAEQEADEREREKYREELFMATLEEEERREWEGEE